MSHARLPDCSLRGGPRAGGRYTDLDLAESGSGVAAGRRDEGPRRTRRSGDGTRHPDRSRAPCSGRHPGNGHGPPAPELAGGIRDEQRTSPAGSARRKPGGNRVCGPFRSRSAVHAVPRASRAGMSRRRRLIAGVPVDDEAHRSLDLQTPCPHTQRVRLDKDRLPGRRDLPSVRSARRHHNDQRTTCGGDLVGAQRAAGRHGEHSRASVGQTQRQSSAGLLGGDGIGREAHDPPSWPCP